MFDAARVEVRYLFFFQAEDGIRDFHVTGVQTCALPIWGIRPALPIDLSTAAPSGTSWVVSGPLTALQLLPLVGGGPVYVHGTVAKAPGGAAQRVVAEPLGGGAGLTGVADRDGSYAIFNLALGTSYVVTAYAKGANYVPVTTGVLTDVDNTVSLALAGAAGATVTGDLISTMARPTTRT